MTIITYINCEWFGESDNLCLLLRLICDNVIIYLCDNIFN